jgi:nitroreductase
MTFTINRVDVKVTLPRALTDFALTRFSPTKFDPSHSLHAVEAAVLIEAAGRAPSAGNSQPWVFIVAHRGDATHERLVPLLARSSARWAPDASLLLVNLAQRYAEDSDIEYSEFAQYDLGQAVAHLTFQAHAMGLAVHQFRAFDKAAVTAEFGVPPHFEVASMAAVGVAAPDARQPPGTSSVERKPLDALLWSAQP